MALKALEISYWRNRQSDRQKYTKINSPGGRDRGFDPDPIDHLFDILQIGEPIMSANIDQIRSNTLKQIERTERHYKLAFVAAALLELAFFASFLMLADLSNRSHLLLFVAAVAIYAILAVGLIALGIHINRSTLRVIKAIEVFNKPQA